MRTNPLTAALAGVTLACSAAAQAHEGDEATRLRADLDFATGLVWELREKLAEADARIEELEARTAGHENVLEAQAAGETDKKEWRPPKAP